jgi:hypothetical protein
MITGRIAPLLIGVAMRQYDSPTARLQRQLNRPVTWLTCWGR